MNIRCRADSYYRAADACAGGPVSLYIHYPFCVRKCRYCDFLSGPSDEETRQRYLDALCEEIREKSALMKEWNRRRRTADRTRRSLPGSVPDSLFAEGPSEQSEVDSIFFGGGTPSLMTPGQLDHLMFLTACCFRVDEDAEITLECNPGTAGEEELRSFCRSGVNRISIGVQSFHDKELALLGRIHTAQEAGECVRNARRAGCSNLSIDLMTALPGQTYDQWMDNLQQAVRLEPEHLSAYGLILEEGTPMKADFESGHLAPLPEEDEDRRMYHDTKTFLEHWGYRRYEISNYAKPGFESRHNSGYWTGHPYLGLGLGASSYLILPDDEAADCPDEKRTGRAGAKPCGRRIRWSSTTNLTEYLRRYDPAGRDARRQEAELSRTAGFPAEPDRTAEILTEQDQMAEFMFLGLRRMQGVSEADFAAEFGCPIDEIYGGVLRKYIGFGLLRREGGRIALTDPGIDVSNTVMADFLLT